jgi:hypothetical protein
MTVQSFRVEREIEIKDSSGSQSMILKHDGTMIKTDTNGIVTTGESPTKQEVVALAIALG